MSGDGVTLAASLQESPWSEYTAECSWIFFFSFYHFTSLIRLGTKPEEIWKAAVGKSHAPVGMGWYSVSLASVLPHLYQRHRPQT